MQTEKSNGKGMCRNPLLEEGGGESIKGGCQEAEGTLFWSPSNKT